MPLSEEEDAADNNSEDEALLEVLGLSSMGCLTEEQDEESDQHDGNPSGHKRSDPAKVDGYAHSQSSSYDDIPQHSSSGIQSIIDDLGLPRIYKHDQFAVFPGELSIPAQTMRRLADELIWGSNSSVPLCGGSGTCRRGTECDRTYETIRVAKKKKRNEKSRDCSGTDTDKDSTGEEITSDDNHNKEKEEDEYEVERRRVLTRLENFVTNHDGWSNLCLDYLTKLISALCGEPMVLYKEKLNIKPPGGSGFAPHLDSPSLRVALGSKGPQEFVTVMVAIDDMTVRNGCLRVAKGPYSEHKHVEVVLPKDDGNPDGDGRAGAIIEEVASELEFEDVVVKGGTVAAFGGWVPHRSAVNTSPFSRRAVFLTYNPAREGSFRERYYERMKEMRDGWRNKIGLAGRQQEAMSEDERMEMEALASIPKV